MIWMSSIIEFGMYNLHFMHIRQILDLLKLFLPEDFNHDKRDLSIINVLLLLLESLILISLISLLIKIKIRQTFTKIFSNKIEASEKSKKFLELFINKITHVFICFIIPLIFSFAMIYAVSNLIPNPEGDFREASI